LGEGLCNFNVVVQIDYYDVQQELLQRNVHLHVFTTQSIEVVDAHTHELIGFSATTMYTTSGGEQPQLRQALSSPHDSCTVLAQEVNGTVWTMQDKEVASSSSSSHTYIYIAVIGILTSIKHNWTRNRHPTGGCERVSIV
jgi:hypothetical protein